MNIELGALQIYWRQLLRRVSTSKDRQLHSTRVAIELRNTRILALRWQENRPAQIKSIECMPAERKTVLAALRRDGWFNDARVELMLGLGQRQLNSAPRPAVLDTELRDALRWQLRDALDYSPEEAVIDVLPIADTEPAGRQEVIVFTIRRTELGQLIEPFNSARIPLQRVATIDCAQRNLAWHGISDQRPTALLLPCDGGALCTVSMGEQLILSRSIDIGNDLSPGTWRFEQTAERIAVQLQRSFDLLERRSADAAITDLVVSDWGATAPLFQRIAGLTSPYVQFLDYQSFLKSETEDPDGYLHLLGVCLSEPPADGRDSLLRQISNSNIAEPASTASRASGASRVLARDDQPYVASDDGPEQEEDRQTRIETLSHEADLVSAELSISAEGVPVQPSGPLASRPPLEFSTTNEPVAATAIDAMLLNNPQFALAEELRNLVAARNAASDVSLENQVPKAVVAEVASPEESAPDANGKSATQTGHRLEILR